MGKILDPNRAGPGAVCEAGERVEPLHLPNILHAHSWDNPWPDGTITLVLLTDW
jgi:hypothetical protein